MRTIDKQDAIDLRRKGFTYDEIQKHLKISKGTLSFWLRDIPFTLSTESYYKKRSLCFHNSQVSHQRKIQRTSQIVSETKREILAVKLYELKLLGAIAYWTEGSKTQDNQVKFTNSDPKLIKFILRWLREICFVPENKLRVHLRIHGDLDREETERYWSKLTGIKLDKFHKTTFKTSNSESKRHNKLKYGIASITVCDTNLFYKIKGWIEGITESLQL